MSSYCSDYSIAQPSLEQIFIGFAEEHGVQMRQLSIPDVTISKVRRESFDFYNADTNSEESNIVQTRNTYSQLDRKFANIL